MQVTEQNRFEGMKEFIAYLYPRKFKSLPQAPE